MKKIPLVVLLVCLCFLMIFAASCAEKEKELTSTELFHNLAVKLEENDFSLTKDDSAFYAAINKTGLIRYEISFNKGKGLREDFVKEYIEKYSLDDLIKSIGVICSRCATSSVSRSSPCNIEYILELLSEKTTIERLSKEQEGTKSNYYRSNPDALPTYRTTETRGKFFDSSNVRIYYASKTNTHTPTFYGKYAIEKFDGYKYDEGLYGWYNGKFVDKPSSFQKDVYYTLYCQGVSIIKETREDLFFKADTYIMTGKNASLIYYSKKEENANFENVLIKSIVADNTIDNSEDDKTQSDPNEEALTATAAKATLVDAIDHLSAANRVKYDFSFDWANGTYAQTEDAIMIRYSYIQNGETINTEFYLVKNESDYSYINSIEKKYAIITEEAYSELVQSFDSFTLNSLIKDWLATQLSEISGKKITTTDNGVRYEIHPNNNKNIDTCVIIEGGEHPSLVMRATNGYQAPTEVSVTYDFTIEVPNYSGYTRVSY